MPPEQPQPKISYIEAFFVGSYIAITDLAGMALVFLGLDDFFILDTMTFPVTQFYFRIKRVKGTADLIMNILELIPYVGALPLRTLGFALVVWIDHHPRGIAGKTLNVANNLPGAGLGAKK
jgi:hypothetical protein